MHLLLIKVVNGHSKDYKSVAYRVAQRIRSQSRLVEPWRRIKYKSYRCKWR